MKPTEKQIRDTAESVLWGFDWKKAQAINIVLGRGSIDFNTGRILLNRCVDRYLLEGRQSVVEESDGLRASIMVYDESVDIDLSLVAIEKSLLVC